MKKIMQRARVYKRLMARWIEAHKGMAFKVKLERPTAKELGRMLHEEAEGLAVANVARDIRELTSPGEKFDAEFAFLYHGMRNPHFIERYSETYLSSLARHVMSPEGVNAGLRRLRADGKRVWEEV